MQATKLPEILQLTKQTTDSRWNKFQL